MLKRYTQEEVNDMIAGWDDLPADCRCEFSRGDYTQVKQFHLGFYNEIHFQGGSTFGSETSFASNGALKFGSECHFRSGCRFDGSLHFGAWCDFYKATFHGFSAFEQFCELADCTALAGTRFGRGCSLTGTTRLTHHVMFSGALELDDFNEVFIDGRCVEQTLQVGPLGSRAENTLFFSARDERGIFDIWVVCGCFFGTLSEFREKVKDRYSTNAHHPNFQQYHREYLAAGEFAWHVLAEGKDNGTRL